MAQCIYLSLMSSIKLIVVICVFAICYVFSFFSAIIIFLIFIVIPVVFRYTPSLQRGMIFLNYVRLPYDVSYDEPEKYGLKGTRNFYIKTQDNITLGIWCVHNLAWGLKSTPLKLSGIMIGFFYVIGREMGLNNSFGASVMPSIFTEIAPLNMHVLPRKLLNEYENDKSSYENLLSHGEPIVIYMHGNSGTRANDHRIQLYHVLQNIDCHVIAVDYRGYADSTDVEVSENGIVTDAMEIFKWTYKRANGTPIFGWGHSLGTGIGSHAYSLLEKEGFYPNGLILEAPFTKMSEEIREYPLTKIHRLLPWFEFFIIDPVEENHISFDTQRHLMNTKMHLLILHAKDDIVVPYKLGEKLYNHLLKTRSNTLTEFELYDESHKYGHKNIFKDKQLGSRIKKFINDSMKSTPQ